MGKTLIIVESPAKIKTLQKLLGSDYMFESSVGHIRDLPKKGFGIDIENNFTPQYEPLEDKKQVITNIKKAAKQCDVVYLSPDPDREGEAIAWHIAALLPKGTKYKRVSFNSLTKEAVQEAVNSPREIDMALVDAQQARRLLDRIVGYKISPILARKVQGTGSLSAGRVQSVALKLVVDREQEIDAFNPVEYWNINAILNKTTNPQKFKGSLHSIDGERVEKELTPGKANTTVVDTKEKADSVVARINESNLHISRVEKKEKKRKPVPPFITSTIQQEASRYYSFSSSRTMGIAQTLYEGIDLGSEEREGLITYMRTDSVRVAPEAIADARTYITENFGENFLPPTYNKYSSKKTAQDAHEAIRPTHLNHTPESIKEHLSIDQFKLYQLIWRRFIASQMNPAIYDTVSADASSNNGIVLRITGSTIKFSGFLAVYEEKTDDEETTSDENRLPELTEGEPLNKDSITSDQAFTKPPARFSEASLVKELEKSGIGRPSTYATIMNKIQSREYTVKEGGRLKPTELGKVIAKLLETSFIQIMNIGFTATLEDQLERVAANRKNWISLIKEFWEEFIPTVEIAEKEAHVPKEFTDIDCPKCSKKLQKIWSKSKYFYGCSGYPECKYTASIEEYHFNKEDYLDTFDWDQKCSKCQGDMQLRHGRYGPFLGCTKYPECRGIVNIPKKGEEYIPDEEMPKCPAIGCEGNLTSKRSRFGKTFYSCNTFPECNVIVNNLDDLENKYHDHPRTAYVKKTKSKKKSATTKKKGKAKTAKKESKPRNMPALTLSPELSHLLGKEELPRTQVVKELWVYIKAHNLQDETNKRIINPDEKLAKVFGSNDPIDMFKMTAKVSQHMKKKE